MCLKIDLKKIRNKENVSQTIEGLYSQDLHKIYVCIMKILEEEYFLPDKQICF